MKVINRVLFIIILGLILSACGNKGDLYLPEKDKNKDKDKDKYQTSQTK